MRLVFMGTPAFAVPALAYLYDAGHQIIAVYTQPPRPAGRGQKEMPSPVQAYATAHKLPVFTPASLKSPQAQAEFAGHKADAAIVAAYGLLLPKPVLDAFPLGCINIHPSLLPRWRGAAPIQRALMAGDAETAVTIMQMDEGLDTGDMLLMERYPVAKGMKAGALHDFLAEKSGPLLLRALQGIQDKTLTPVKQDDTPPGYAKKITKEDCAIDWNRSAEAIYHQIMGLSPAPGAQFAYGGEAIKVLDATYYMTPVGIAPGTVIDERLGIACNPGILRPTLLQRPGKKKLAAEEWLRGFSIPTGTRLA